MDNHEKTPIHRSSNEATFIIIKTEFVCLFDSLEELLHRESADYVHWCSTPRYSRDLREIIYVQVECKITHL